MPEVTVTVDRKALDALLADVAELDRLKVTVGIHGDEGPHSDGGLTVAQLGAIHEFGIGVPQRSFLRSTLKTYARKIEANMGKAGARVVEGKLEPKQALGIVGEDLVGEIKRRIRDREIPQGLAESTKRRKERTNVTSTEGTGALIDTGQLINSITQRVTRA